MTALDARVAIVTGGAGPLGVSICGTLAELGARVVVVDLHEDCVAAEAERLNDLYGATRAGGAHFALQSDLMVPSAAETVVKRVVEEAGRIDIIINNAALTGTSGVPGYAVPILTQSDKAFLSAVQLNLVAPFSLVRQAAPYLARRNQGVVVNISSIYGIVGPNMRLYDGTDMGNPAAYAATKGGLVQMTRYLATVLAPDIRVNAIAPGGIARGQDQSFVDRYSALTPLGRMASEDDIRGTLALLASDASAYVTGQVIAVDGGWTAW